MLECWCPCEQVNKDYKKVVYGHANGFEAMEKPLAKDERRTNLRVKKNSTIISTHEILTLYWIRKY